MEIIKNDKYKCPKCNNNEFEQDQFQAVGGIFSKMLDIQNKKFVTTTCTNCGYTEMYKRRSDDLENILDFFVGK